MSVYETRFWTKNYDWKTPPDIVYPKYPAYTLLRISSLYQPNRPATHFFGAEITYNELYLMCTRLANVLVEQGVKKGDRVGIMLPTSPQFVVAYWAILMTGAIVVNLNVMYTVEELKFLFKDAEMTALFTVDTAMDKVREIVKEVPVPTIIITKMEDFMAGTTVSTSEELKLDKGWLHLSEVLKTNRRWAPPLVDINWDDPAVIQYTGGTTGFPKGAVLTQYNITSAAIGIVRWAGDYVDSLPYDRRRVLCCLPYNHIYGEICGIGYTTWQCGTQVLLHRFIPDEIFDTLHKFDFFSYWPTVPTMIQALFYNPRVEEIDWHAKIGYTGSGASPAPKELIDKCRQYDFNFNEGYGMSETAAAGISTPGTGKVRPKSVGVPYPNMDVRFVDEDGNDVPLGQPGEIWMKGPYIMKEYWRRPEDTKAVFTEDGWLKSGDVGYMDEDGWVYLVDRTKDLIIAGGLNVYPNEVDETIMKHPKVMDAITIGVPDEYRGETVKSFVQLKPGQTATEEDIINFCREHLAPYKVPRVIEFRTELPRSATGKALRRILRDEEIAKKQS